MLEEVTSRTEQCLAIIKCDFDDKKIEISLLRKNTRIVNVRSCSHFWDICDSEKAFLGGQINQARNSDSKTHAGK